MIPVVVHVLESRALLNYTTIIVHTQCSTGKFR